MKRYYLAALILVLIAVAAGVASALVAKPHVTDRLITEDLRSLETSLYSYHDKNRTLPDALSQLDINSDLKSRTKNYEYTHTSAVSSAQGSSTKTSPGVAIYPTPSSQVTFKLCATFKTDTYDSGKISGVFDPENHHKGRQCFTEDIY